MIMKKAFSIIGFVAAILLFGACEPAEEPTAMAICDRACLEDFADRYLDALLAHDASKLPLAEDARYTENGQTLAMNNGMWQVASAIGDPKLYFSDPVSGQVGFRGVVEENGHKQIIMARPKVENRQIREIEAIVLREGGAFSNVDGLADHPIFSEALSPDDRSSRDELISIADSYFEGLEKNLADITPFDPNCTRIENGTITANNPDSETFHRLTCGDRFKIPGFSAVITRIRERRFPIVDEERGLVYAIVFFDHAGVPEVTLPDGSIRKIEPPPSTPPSA